MQSYPSRSKDPDPVDYSTGSVGIGATAPIWGAIARRYVNSAITDTGRGRQYSLVGDAELDEGAVWEAVLDSSVGELGEIVWIIDLNRQSLDRVVPNITAGRLEKMFAAAGWQVITVNFGKLLEELFTRPGGEALRIRILQMSNPEYQRLLRCSASELRTRLPGAGDTQPPSQALVGELDDGTLLRAIRNLGGHDLEALRAAYEQIDDSRPTVIIAYTIKGYGLPTEGHPQNHSVTADRRAVRPVGRHAGHGHSRSRGLGSTPTLLRDGCARRPPRGYTDTTTLICTAIGADRYRAHPIRHNDHAGRARPCFAGPDP